MVNAVWASAQYTGSGSGTEDDPYIILNADQFYSIRNFTGTGVFFSLLTDIDLSDYSYGSGWNPITSFSGTLNGNGHKVTGLYINKSTTDYVGLFSQTNSAQIKNLTVEGDVTGGNYVGGIAGCTYSSGYNVEYENVHFVGTVNGKKYVGGIAGYDKPSEGYTSVGPGIEYSKCGFSGTISGDDYLGGIVGYASAEISNAVVDAKISGNQYIGGVSGSILGSTKGWSIEDCYAAVDISATAGYVGGICGNGLGSSVERCAVSGNIVAAGDKVGGIIGYATCYSGVSKNANIDNSYFTGYIKANDLVGGIIGYNGGDGWQNSKTKVYWGFVYVQNNYVKGTVIGHDKVGGILSGYTYSNNPTIANNVCMCSTIESETSNVGRIQANASGATPKECYALTTTKVRVGGISMSDSAIQANTKLLHGTDIGAKNLKSATFYQGLSWDFSSTWCIINTECLPYLKTQAAPPVIQSSLVSGDVEISGNSINGGTVKVKVGDTEYSATTDDNLWSITTPALQAGTKVTAQATADELAPSYKVETYVGYSGAGTQDDPYQIKTADDLANVNGSGCYKLVADINLSTLSSKTWQPLGIKNEAITYLDGDNHKITNLAVSSDDDLVGLFSSLTDATIKNLTLETATNQSVKGADNVGILAGRLNNCTVENVSIKGAVSGNTNVGALAGLINGGTLSNIVVSNTQVTGKNYLGGIAGSSSATATHCLFAGTVADSVETSDKIASGTIVYTGGLFGTSQGEISESMTEGEVTAKRDASRAGGLVGDNYGAIANCYSVANVTGHTYAAGLVANNHANVSKCYASGNIATTDSLTQSIACGLIGYNDGTEAIIANSAAMNKYIISSSAKGNVFRIIGGTKNSAPIPGTSNYAAQNMILSTNGIHLSQSDDPYNGYVKTNAALKTQSLYEANGWDFTSVWAISEKQSYPTLQQLGSVKTETEDVLVTKLTLSTSALTAKVGETNTLSATLEPTNATKADLTWTSSNTSVATVSSDGTVTAIAAGQATITTTTTDGSNLSASCEVTVTEDKSEATDSEDTDVSQFGNVVYAESTEAAAGQQITLSLKMNNSIAPTGFQCDVYLPDGVTFATDDDGFYLISLSTARTTTQKTNYFDNALQSDGAVRILASSTKNYTFSGTEGEVATITLNVSSDIKEGKYPIVVKNVVIADASAKTYEVDYVKSTLTISSYTLGDANNDGKINVGDFSAIAGYIVGTPASPFVEKAADVNGDGKINVGDLTGVATLILHGTLTTASTTKAAARHDAMPSTVNVADSEVSAGEEFTIDVNVSNETPFSGFQLDLVLPKGISVKTTDGTPCVWLSSERTNGNHPFFTSRIMEDGTLRLLSASMNGATFDGTEGAIAHITLVADDKAPTGSYRVGIERALLAANGETQVPSAAPFTIRVSNATGINGIEANDDVDFGIYDLSGRKMSGNSANLKKGVYIINGKKVIK